MAFLKLLFIFTLTWMSVSTSSASDTQSDSLALVTFYHQTDGPNWITKTNWLTGPLSTWHGIGVSNGRVEIIQLYANNLNGSIPPEIGQLDALRELWVHFNKLKGDVPIELSDLHHLEVLYINDNELTGPLQPSWGNFTKMREFYVNNNRFTGHIPPELSLMATTMMFNVSKNQLTGPIPPELGNLTNLGRLCLWGNRLTGPIPPELGNLRSMGVMQFDNNQLSGPIPAEIGNLTELRQLRLHNNLLSGEIPASIGNLENLQTINLSGNQLTGAIPTEILNMEFLITVNFSKNQLTGEIPAGILELPNLMGLQLNDNEFHSAPDFETNGGIVQFHLQNNHLTFKDLLPNVGVANIFTMFPQRAFGMERRDTLEVGAVYSFDPGIDYAGNSYQWYQDDQLLDGQTTSVLDIISFDAAHAGIYRLDVRNSASPNVVLSSAPIHLVQRGTTDIDIGDRESGIGFELEQNYPNPFNPTTLIRFSLRTSHLARLAIYDILGREVAVLVDGWMSAGEHQVRFDAAGLSSGVYIYALTTSDSQRIMRRMTLVR